LEIRTNSKEKEKRRKKDRKERISEEWISGEEWVVAVGGRRGREAIYG